MTGIALWGVGNVLAGLGTTRFGAPWLYVAGPAPRRRWRQHGVRRAAGGRQQVVSRAARSCGGLVVGRLRARRFRLQPAHPAPPAFHAFAAHAGEVPRGGHRRPNAAGPRCAAARRTQGCTHRSCRSSSAGAAPSWSSGYPPPSSCEIRRPEHANRPSSKCSGGRPRLFARERRPHAAVLPAVAAAICPMWSPGSRSSRTPS